MDENTVNPVVEDSQATVMENLPAEVPAELPPTEIQKFVQEDMAREDTRLRIMATQAQFHQATPQHFENKQRGVGITRKNHSASKKARKQEKKSRRNNRRK